MGHRLFLVSQLVLLIISTTTNTTHAGGHAREAAAITKAGMDDGSVVGSMMKRSMSMVGSRPPICDGRCWWCGGRRCEAVQVPITPQEQGQEDHRQKTSHRHGRGSSGAGGGGASSWAAQHEQEEQQQRRPSLYDDHSNYKPLSWRCKCAGG